ncbi:hypothetical protein [Phenylobacterium sp.]|jgi:hypothetical protein|uniref:hypothetical protein n=1 Tax=Phenylobacterium sp. TaxID=1871053 RepID=UPI002F41D478
MDRSKDIPPAETPPLLSEAEINALMRQPVRSRPAVTVVGDEVVSGFTPAPPSEPIKPAG